MLFMKHAKNDYLPDCREDLWTLENSALLLVLGTEKQKLGDWLANGSEVVDKDGEYLLVNSE